MTKDGGAVVVTLVHGTFAARSSWTQADSEFCTALRRHLIQSGYRPIFRAFTWSGANTFAARLRAARALCTYLRGTRSEYPNARHFAVGHSHGGTVLSYALRSKKAQRALDGVAFLSSPFVALRERPYAGLLNGAVIYGSVWTFAFVVPFLLLAQFGPLLEPQVSSTIMMVMLGAVLSVVSIFGADLSFWWGTSLVLAIASRADAIRRRYDSTNLPRGNYIFLRCAGDEAGAVLAVMQSANWLIGVLVYLYGRLVDRVAPKLYRTFSNRIVQSVLPLSLFAVVLLGWRWLQGGVDFVLVDFSKVVDGGPLRIAWAMLLLLLGLIALPAIALVCGFFVFALLAAVAAAVAFWPFGRAAILPTLYLDISVEPIAKGQFALVHIPWEVDRRRADRWEKTWDEEQAAANPMKFGSHAVYSSRKAQEIIAAWICRSIPNATGRAARRARTDQGKDWRRIGSRS